MSVADVADEAGPEQPRTRIAVLGSGRIAHAHVEALARVPGAEVSHVLGSDVDRARRVAALAPGALAVTHLDDVLADPDVDGVYVCGLTPSHAERAIRAASAGKHVLVEKPPARDLATFDRMRAAAEVAGVRIMVGQTVRFQPAIRAMAAQVAVGSIGRPMLLHTDWYVGHVWPGAWRAWQFDVARSGGHLVHNGMHPIDLAIWLIGQEPVRVFTRGWSTHAPELPTPDSFHLTLRFAGGAIAMLTVSYGLRRPGESLRRTLVAGTEGTLVHHTADDVVSAGTTSPAPPLSTAGALDGQAAHVVAMMSGVVLPLVDLADSRWALATAIAAQRSLDEGRPVEVGEVTDG